MAEYRPQGLQATRRRRCARSPWRKFDIGLGDVGFMGDDVNDMGRHGNRWPGWSAAPSRCRCRSPHLRAARIDLVTTQRSGGNGAVREFADRPSSLAATCAAATSSCFAHVTKQH